ncbi:MAG: hypothetical protein K2L70_00900 [Clostridia bacterium]|nr:hypothetical protein [Clostridia bacterium]
MKNTKEIQTILTAIYCINLSKRDKRDKDIDQICEYAFARIFDSNTNLLIACCTGRTQEEILEEVNEIMYSETKYKKYLDSKKGDNK